ncbi:unnamed protein product [marine sediment metagenome]|uniref:CopG family transcriptional regulator n=1 Tax=marine sediment metagenome TaxID=412755 RepID=X1U6D4_9ZZZZ
MPAIRVQISKELHKRLKMRALQDDSTLQKLVPFALDAWLSYDALDAQRAKAALKAQRAHKAPVTIAQVITKVKPKVTKT